MSITSLNFAAFVSASILLFIVFPQKYKWISLLISSICFYLAAGIQYIPFLTMTAFTTWAGAFFIDRNSQKLKQELKGIDSDRSRKKVLKASYKKRQKTILCLVLILNIGILCLCKLFKYLAVSFASLAAMLTGQAQLDALEFIVPLGISYYTFSTVGYLLDVYWKRYKCEKNFARFFLYAVYFPHIVQGPISRYSNLGQELKKPLSFRWDNFKYGCYLILWGYFKKLVIADRLNIFVTQAFWSTEHEASVYVAAMVFDAIQIYADFSGYTDIVRGISQIFGVELEPNFNHPFFSRTVPEFWRRWHMSLGSWFKDYIYYPVTVSRPMKEISKRSAGKLSPRTIKFIITIIPVMITWLLTGLWHGTGKGYVLWGIYYGTLITLSVTFSHDIQRLQTRLGINTACFSWRLFQHIKIFCIFMGGRLLGRGIGPSFTLLIVKKVLRYPDFWAIWDGSLLQLGLDGKNLLIAFIGTGIMILVSILQERCRLRETFERQNLIFKWIILYGAIFSIFLLGIYGTSYNTSSFMYQQF